MTKSELLELIANGENSGVEFKSDNLRPEQLAKEVVALANFRGGRILLGVEEDGAITGVRRQDLEHWVIPLLRIWSGEDPEFLAAEDYLRLTMRRGPASAP